MEKDPFKEYLRESEPDKAGKGYAWSTAIGLQAVDGLKTSKYLIDTAIQNIEGKFIFLERAIQGRRQYSLSSISERLVSPQPMIFLQKMRGILEMHWFVPIILTCKKAFTKLRNILKCSLEIYL